MFILIRIVITSLLQLIENGDGQRLCFLILIPGSLLMLDKVMRTQEPLSNDSVPKNLEK